MRLPIIILLCCALTGSAAASERYPYRAPILAEETPVLSGPGAEFHITSELRRGETVEVYYETEDWCAVRPPIGSFSWISARYVELGTNGIGTVIADGLASRIGSEQTELCDTVQVKLRKGEKVLVIGRRETPENPASPLWYKISPPSGEFRWIPRLALFENLPSPKNDRAIVQVVYETETNPATAAAPMSLPGPMLPRPPRTMQTPQMPVAATPVARQTQQTETSASNDVLAIPPLSTLLASASKTVKETPRPVDPVRQAFDKAFEELKEETRNALIRPTEDWVFQTLIERGNELYDVAPTDTDLEKVYHLVETLQRTWDVRKEIAYRRQFRTGGLLTPPPSATPSPTTPGAAYPVSPYTRNNGAPAPQPATQQAPYASTFTPTPNAITNEPSPQIPGDRSSRYGFKLHGYDVVGKLGEFEDPPQGYPPYAVVDENERILCLITPAVGIELKEHIGKMVGINGILGFYEKNNQPKRRHITVQEIEILRIPTH